MKKIKILSFASLPLAMALLAGCGHQHTFSEEWKYDESKHWHEATCEHKDQISGEGFHADGDNDGKCDACGYEMATPTPADDGKVSADEWLAAFATSKPYYLADNYKLTMLMSIGDQTKSGDLIVDGNKLKAVESNGDASETIFNEIANGKKYEYDYNSETKKWSRKEAHETAADDMAEFFLPFAQNYSKFAFDDASKSYKCTSLTFEGAAINDMVIKFDKKQIVELAFKSSEGDGGAVVSATISVSYGGQKVDLPAYEDHVHDYHWANNVVEHWKECACGDTTEHGNHYDDNFDNKCDICEAFVAAPSGIKYTFRSSSGLFSFVVDTDVEGQYKFEGADGSGSGEFMEQGQTFDLCNINAVGRYVILESVVLGEKSPTESVSLSNGVLTVTEAASYKFYFKPGEGKLYVVKVEGPLPSEPVYGYKINDGEYEVMNLEDKEGTKQWVIANVGVEEGQTVTFANITPEVPETLPSLSIGGETQGFAVLSGILTAGHTGNYNFYLQPNFENDIVYIAENSSPIPEVDCKLMGSFDGWTEGYKMTLQEGTTQYVIENVTVQSAQYIKVKFGDDYIDDFKTTGGNNNAFEAKVCRIESTDAFFDLNAVVNVYFNSDKSGDFGVFIELKNVISPYKGEAFVGGQSVGELTFKFNKVDSSYVEYSLLNAPVAPGIEYELQFSNGSPINIRTIEEGGEGEKFTIVGTRLVYSGTKTALDFYLKDYGADYDVYVEEHVEPVTYNTLYLNPGDWANDGATFCAYFFDSTDKNPELWVMLESEDGLYKVNKVNGYDKVIFVRCNPAKDPLVDHWDAKWNQTDDLDVPNDANVKCTITGWGEPGQNSTSTWGTK